MRSIAEVSELTGKNGVGLCVAEVNVWSCTVQVLRQREVRDLVVGAVSGGLRCVFLGGSDCNCTGH